MVIVITSDADMPSCLDDSTKQISKALALANILFKNDAKEARLARPQGFFSRTVIISLGDGPEVVIQFRPEELDITPFHIARKALGPVVPEIQRIEDAQLKESGIWVYWMNCIPGRVWCSLSSPELHESRVTTVQSLGSILSRGFVEGSQGSQTVIDQRLRPHLELLRKSKDPNINRFASTSHELQSKLHLLQPLPLFIAHFDLNNVNILIDESYQVSGIIDWELSVPLPLGMGFCRIHTLAGEYTKRTFRVTERYEAAEMAFWDAILDGLSPHIRQVCRENLDGVQVALTVGTLLDAFQLDENGELGDYNPVVIDALPALLSYTIPMLRGEGQKPYTTASVAPC